MTSVQRIWSPFRHSQQPHAHAPHSIGGPVHPALDVPVVSADCIAQNTSAWLGATVGRTSTVPTRPNDMKLHGLVCARPPKIDDDGGEQQRIFHCRRTICSARVHYEFFAVLRLHNMLLIRIRCDCAQRKRQNVFVLT